MRPEIPASFSARVFDQTLRMLVEEESELRQFIVGCLKNANKDTFLGKCGSTLFAVSVVK